MIHVIFNEIKYQMLVEDQSVEVTSSSTKRTQENYSVFQTNPKNATKGDGLIAYAEPRGRSTGHASIPIAK